ncbi:hypothetical protein [Labilibacter marinus]|uniref:hypothetical protein n=1 Tax=Labilibacter marinus TaxID=1477105 RepID=UPI00094F85AF|nr:hypothetical protein [Labilibacter marinus]
MKNVLLSVFFAILIVACVAKEAKDKKKEKAACCETSEKSTCCEEKKTTESCCSDPSDTTALAISVDDLLASPEKYIDKKVELTGLVMHTCKQTGKKMFIAGSNDSIYIRIEASEEISTFEPSLEGNKIAATGIVTLAKKEPHMHAEGEPCTAEQKNDYTLTCQNFKTL